MNRTKFAILGLGLSSILPVAAHADDLNNARLDLATPDVPAFTALGVSPSKVSMPTNVKDFVAALASGISSAGHVQSGVAIEVSPGQLLLTQRNPDGSAKQLATVLDGLAVSMATNALATATEPTLQAAIGVRWAFFGYTPQGDKYLAECIAPSIPSVEPPQGLDENGEPTTPVHVADTHEFKIGRQTCREVFRALHLASSGLQFAYVHSAQAVGDTKLSSFSTLADTIWASGSLGFNKAKRPKDVPVEQLKPADAPWGVQPTLFARYDAINLGSGLGRQSDLFFAARLPFITPGWSAFVEAGYKKFNLVDKASPPAATGYRLPIGLGGDVRLGDGTWFGLYAGADLKSGEILSLGNVKWSVGEKRPYEY